MTQKLEHILERLRKASILQKEAILQEAIAELCNVLKNLDERILQVEAK